MFVVFSWFFVFPCNSPEHNLDALLGLGVVVGQFFLCVGGRGLGRCLGVNGDMSGGCWGSFGSCL